MNTDVKFLSKKMNTDVKIFHLLWLVCIVFKKYGEFLTDRELFHWFRV